MTDSKYFTTTKKGEIFELKSELNNDKKEKKKEAVKKVIASMTVGKDVSALFPDVVNCMQTDNLELKKLVYLYLMNYAKSQPDMAIMAVNTFVKELATSPMTKDCDDPNPLIRALAVRTMGCIRVDKITEYLCEPLRKCLKDDDPYVRKTAAVCVAKLYDINATLVEDQGFLDQLKDLLSDSNPMVLMKLVEMLQSESDFVGTLTKKLAPPLVTLLSSEPEVQYVALRNINLIVQKRPDILKHEMKVFFVKYNDPIYVKLEKLDIMIRLASQANIAQVLSELKEYATEVDVDFVRKAVRAIGRCAIKVEPSAERCVSTLLDLIKTKVNYVVQEAIVVIKDIFRKYPNKYETIISTLCENLDTLDEPEARASMIWIIGEYAERIDNADELLESFLEGFHDENTQVQLQLLTAIVKLFLKRPTDTQELVQQVLSLATQDSDNPDLRDRGFIYWRLLSTDPAAAKEVVLAEKPLISEETDLIEPTLLDELICHISSLASVYHKPPTAFVEGRAAGARKSLPARSNSGEDSNQQAAQPHAQVIPALDSMIGDLLSMDIGGPTAVTPTPAPQSGLGLDLLGGGLDGILGGTDTGNSAPVVSQSTTGLLGDIFGFNQGPTSYVAPKVNWLPAEKGKGFDIWGTFSRKNGQISMDMTFTNKAMQPMGGFAIQLNKNSFGLTPAAPLQVPSPLNPGASIDTSIILSTNGAVQRMEPLNNLQVAIKNNIDVFYFACLVPMNVYFAEDGQLDKRVFLSTWKDIPAQNEVQYTLKGIMLTADQVVQKMQQNNVFTIAKRNVEGQDMLYQSLKLTNTVWVLNELKIQPGNPDVTLSLKSRSVEVAPGIFQAYNAILHS
ncbi:unnamed protein product [Xylocopa violacea]|uniref:AP complex subunit beta n=1 Tax=Xylocopa violacea TaxID=135666 RepID=A0ABP1N5Z5_XYLVO